MAHAQKPDFVFPQNGRFHLNRWGCQFSRLLAAEVCASAWVILDRPRSQVPWEYWLPTPFARFPFTYPPVRHRVPPGSERALPSYSCLQNPWLGGYSPPDPRSLCPQLNLLNPPRKKFLVTPLQLPMFSSLECRWMTQLKGMLVEGCCLKLGQDWFMSQRRVQGVAVSCREEESIDFFGGSQARHIRSASVNDKQIQ